MANNNKNNIDMGKARPSVKDEKRAFKAFSGNKLKANNKKRTQTTNIKKAKPISKRRGEKFVLPKAKADKQVVNTIISAASEKAKQNAKVLGKSLKSKTDKDFKLNFSFISSISNNVKRGIGLGFVVVLVLAIGITVGIFAFMAATSSKLNIGDEAKAKLVRVQDNQEYYMLIAADVDGDVNETPEVLILTRANPVNKQLIFITIPIETYVASSAGGGTTLQKIYENEGDAALIESVSTFSEIGITHYIKINADGIKNLTNALGGIEVDLKEYVDDASVSDIYISQGKSTINGDEVLTLLRSQKFSGGKATISLNQRQACIGTFKAILNNPNINMAIIIDQIAGQLKTDMSVGDILNFIDTFKNIDDDKILQTEVPGYKTMRNNQMVYMIDASEWKSLRSQISYGKVPSTNADLTINDINPGSFTIIIQNGAGIAGAGAMLAEQLKSKGFNVIETSNAESNIYEETLIIYKGEPMKTNAQVIKNTINNGRLVNGDGLYTMNSDILIIIGGDLKI